MGSTSCNCQCNSFLIDSSSKDPQGHLNTYKVLLWQRLNQPPSSHRSATESSCGSSDTPPLPMLKSSMETRLACLSGEVECNKHIVHSWRLCLLTPISWIRPWCKSWYACTDTIWTREKRMLTMRVDITNTCHFHKLWDKQFCPVSAARSIVDCVQLFLSWCSGKPYTSMFVAGSSTASPGKTQISPQLDVPVESYPPSEKRNAQPKRCCTLNAGNA